MKRIVVLFLVLLLFIPVAFAENNNVADVSWWDGSQAKTEKLPLQVNEKYIYAELPDGTIAIVLYFGDEKTADIAASFPGKTVSSINDYAFNFNSYYTPKIEIEDTIYKYSEDKKLAHIIVPDTVQYLGTDWIGGSSWDHYLDFNLPRLLKYCGTNATSYALLSEIPLLPDVIFHDDYYPSSQFAAIRSDILTFEQGYQSIPESWGQWFPGKKIIIPEGVEKIEKYAFADLNDNALIEIQLPQTLKTIEDYAFIGNSGQWPNSWTPELSVRLPESLHYIGKDVFKMTNIKNLTIPPKLEHIDDSAFAECPLTNLTFSEGTTSITTKVFSDRASLATINLPTTLITIGERSFLRSGLTKLVIPANVTTIGEAAFKNSGKLKDITLPASLTSIADDAFSGCDPKAVFTVFTGTYAEKWANEHGYKTKVLVPVTEITLNEESATINKGKTFTLKATVGPKEATSKKVEWISTDPNVATFKDGKVQAKGCGSCDIICRAVDGSGVQAVCHVSVIQMITSLKIQPQKLTIPYGGTGEVGVTLKPEDATNKTLAWTSSDESICTVDENGKITAVGAGDCEIVCATTDGSNKSAKIKIHVPLFDAAEADYTVTEKIGLLIPVDLRGFSVADITHKSSSDNYFLYYFDTKGLHIIPVAEGAAKITLTSKLNKQDKIVYNVAVDKSALYDYTNSTDEQNEYILDKATSEFHYPSCPKADLIDNANRGTFTGKRAELIRQFYNPCSECNIFLNDIPQVQVDYPKKLEPEGYNGPECWLLYESECSTKNTKIYKVYAKISTKDNNWHNQVKEVMKMLAQELENYDEYFVTMINIVNNMDEQYPNDIALWNSYPSNPRNKENSPELVWYPNGSSMHADFTIEQWSP